MRIALLVLVSMMSSACVVVTTPSYAKLHADASPAAAGQGASDKYGPEPGDSLLQFGGALTSQS
jgi:hypothetical protein